MDQPSQLGNLLAQELRRCGRNDLLVVQLYRLHWERIVGQMIARRTRPNKLQRGTLWIAVQDSSWLYQLQFMREQLLQAVQAFTNVSGVQELKLVLEREHSIPPEPIPPSTSAPTPSPVPSPTPAYCALTACDSSWDHTAPTMSPAAPPAASPPMSPAAPSLCTVTAGTVPLSAGPTHPPAPVRLPDQKSSPQHEPHAQPQARVLAKAQVISRAELRQHFLKAYQRSVHLRESS